MRILADENFPRPFVERLRAGRHDVISAQNDYAGWADVHLLDLAEADGRIILTLDKDFWQIALQRRAPLEKSGVVILRAHPATLEHLEPLLYAFLWADKSWIGHVSVIRHGDIHRVPTRRW